MSETLHFDKALCPSRGSEAFGKPGDEVECPETHKRVVLEPLRHTPNRGRDLDTLAGWGDSMLAAGDQLAEQLRDLQKRDVHNSHWVDQILEEWDEAKKIDA